MCSGGQRRGREPNSIRCQNTPAILRFRKSTITWPVGVGLNITRAGRRGGIDDDDGAARFFHTASWPDIPPCHFEHFVVIRQLLVGNRVQFSRCRGELPVHHLGQADATHGAGVNDAPAADLGRRLSRTLRVALDIDPAYIGA